MKTLLVVIYVAVGVFVATTHHYFKHLSGGKGIISAVLGVLLWPLVLAGVNLHLGIATK
jgi:hypothetical protein